MCRSRNQASTHSISRCRQEHSSQAEKERRKMQRSIRYAANVVCYKCSVPKVVCQRWSADGRVPAEEHTDCQYFEVLIGVVVGIKHGYRVVWEEWQRQMVRRRVNVGQVGEMTRVLGSEAAGQEGGSELVHAFVWLTERVEETR
jgi:hypothetical protein